MSRFFAAFILRTAYAQPSLQSGLLWDKVVSIEPLGAQHVYDIEVQGTHNFIGNGIFAHNTYMRGAGSPVAKPVASSPAQAEEKDGLCVTADTLLPILPSTINHQPLARDYILKPIIEVKPGDYVLSLNEETQAIEPHRINGLLDMGVKPVFKLTTAQGRSIKTTANHPYLTAKGWVKVSELKAGDEIACPIEAKHLYGRVPREEVNAPVLSLPGDGIQSMLLKEDLQELLKQPLLFPLFFTSFSGKNQYTSKDEKDTQNANGNSPENREFFKKITRQSYDEDRLAQISYRLGNKLYLVFRQCLHPEEIYHNLKYLSSLSSITEALANQIDNVSINKAIFWDKIVAIEPVGLEHVYDIEVEGTHNFIGNGIFAHNTYMRGAGSPAEEARIKVIFGRVKTELNENEIVLQHRDLGNYAYNLMVRKMNETDVFQDIYKRVQSQKNILSQRVTTNVEQGGVIAQAELLLRDYFKSLGILYRSVNVAFAAQEIIPNNAGGIYLTYYDTVIFPDNIKRSSLTYSFIHESLHANSFGFAPRKLDEGMTEYLARKLLMKQNGITDFSDDSILDFPSIYCAAGKEEYIPTYVFEVTAALRLIRKAGEPALVIAYFRGDQSLLEAALGRDIWERIIELAFQFEYARDLAVEPYLKEVLQILRGLGSRDDSTSSPSIPQDANKGGVDPSAALRVDSRTGEPGGVDFRALPIVTQPLSGTVPLTGQVRPLRGTAPAINLDKEWQEIQNMLNAGIIPSTERIKEYLVTCCQKEGVSHEIDKVLACLADILRLEEERVSSTEPALRQILVLLESDKSNPELQIALSQIKVLPKEPQLIEQ